jgi:hemerythrin-like domain-containing protein
MPITIGAQPDHTFEEPIGLLTDCHRRIERFLALLLGITERARGGNLTDEQRGQLETALRYFQKAAPLHTADEEESLFPRLRETGDPRAAEALQTIERLEEDHIAANALHDEVDGLGRKWLDAGVLSVDEADRLIRILSALKATYARHIAVEDNEVFPLAEQLLAAGTVRELGREMALRRGLDPNQLPAASRCSSRRL